ncbi:MAG: sulfur oxidation c-type cytochrome SoxX, partial [Burkholderiales bacterium]|nr:sulfur oxidation c-type cytochrome SoxX [Burkholderiales bacterium]
MRHKKLLTAGAVAVALVGCATPAPQPDVDALFRQMMAASFSDKGIAKVDRLQQDATDAACSQAAGAPLPEAQAQALQAANLKTVRLPADGQYLGDWKAGEKLAQDGKGMSWSDKSPAPSANGGSCYNCHQISAAEISYGTIGPSLYHYGKTRGVTDPASPTAQPVVAYTWAKLYNAKAYNACST